MQEDLSNIPTIDDVLELKDAFTYFMLCPSSVYSDLMKLVMFALVVIYSEKLVSSELATNLMDKYSNHFRPKFQAEINDLQGYLESKTIPESGFLRKVSMGKSFDGREIGSRIPEKHIERARLDLTGRSPLFMNYFSSFFPNWFKVENEKKTPKKRKLDLSAQAFAMYAPQVNHAFSMTNIVYAKSRLSKMHVDEERIAVGQAHGNNVRIDFFHMISSRQMNSVEYDLSKNSVLSPRAIDITSNYAVVLDEGQVYGESKTLLSFLTWNESEPTVSTFSMDMFPTNIQCSKKSIVYGGDKFVAYSPVERFDPDIIVLHENVTRAKICRKEQPQLVFFGTEDGYLRLWDRRAKNVMNVVECGEFGDTVLDFDVNDKNEIALLTYDRFISSDQEKSSHFRLFSWKNPKVANKKFEYQSTTHIWSSCFLTDDGFVATVKEDEARLYNLHSLIENPDRIGYQWRLSLPNDEKFVQLTYFKDSLYGLTI